MTVPQFERLTAGLPYLVRGMFYSELYLFIVQCFAAGVGHVIESGVRNGMSTRILRLVWPRLQSVDLKPWRCPVDLRSALIQGNGLDVVPTLVHACAPTPVAVLLDGPKGLKGDGLRRRVWESSHVTLVAQHDSPRGRSETMHSWDETYRREIGDALDARIPAAVIARYSFGGPGLGIWVRA